MAKADFGMPTKVGEIQIGEKTAIKVMENTIKGKPYIALGKFIEKTDGSIFQKKGFWIPKEYLAQFKEILAKIQ